MEPDIKRLGNYRIVSLLGQAELGPVYKGFDVSVERFVALKTVRKDRVFDWTGTHEFQRFRAESQAADMLRHPNIVAIYDYGEERNLAYLAMELIEGRTLAAMLKRGEPIPLPQTVDYMVQFLVGLAHAHGRDVLHGGLCPREVVITDEGVVKLKGFWTAKIDGVELPAERAPEDQVPYLAPEQFLGNPLDKRTDVYGAAALFYHMLTGRAPYRGSFRTIRHDALAGAAPAPSEVAKGLKPFDEALGKAMSKRLEDRYATVEQFALALKAAIKEALPAPSKPAQPAAAAAAAAAVKGGFGRRTLSAGEILFEEGDPGEQAYIIESGVIRIFKPGGHEGEIVLATIGRGEIVGEMALVDNQPRMASARAVEDTVLVVIPRGEFEARLERTDKVTHKLMNVLVNRCRGLADEVKSLKMIIDRR